MAYRNDRTERARLYRLWVIEHDLPCAICGSKLNREIGHIIPYAELPITDEEHCHVECQQCNLVKHPCSKFRLGERIIINGRTPAYITLTRFTPRHIVSIRYDFGKQCNFYTLGSNGRGETKDGQPLEGFRNYEFRSYQLLPYTPRKYGKRRYRMQLGDSRLVPKSTRVKTSANTSNTLTTK